MSRGVVLWPDDPTSARIEDLWRSLEAAGIPSLANHSHRLHRPHLSLVVADGLSPRGALDALEAMSRPTPTLLVNSIGVFAGGVLFLACVPTLELLEAHAAVYDAVAPLARNPWSYYSPGVWTPHMTIAYGLNEDQIARALALVWSYLPMEGHWTTRGVEDSDTGERWLSPASAPP